MIQLYNGDCIEIMQNIPNKSIDMILCDLPYGTTACKWDNIIPFNDLWQQYNRIIKNTSAIVLFGCEPFSTQLRISNIKNYKYDWYWIKNSPNGFQHAKNKPMTKVETISVFSKAPIGHFSLLGRKRMKYYPQGVRKSKIKTILATQHGQILGARPNQVGVKYQGTTGLPSNVLTYRKVAGVKSFHPTQKPVALLEYLIKTYTSEGDIVLDNCMGSGSTGIACINTHRDFIGIELDKYYFEIAKKRIETAEIPLF